MRLTGEDALALRMISLLLAPRPAGYGGDPAPTDVAGVVTWLGAMQAQDIGSAAWSFGVRLPGFTTKDLDAAFERREAIRTWPMRGTVHYVPPRDAHWMLEVMGSRALAGAAKRRSFLGLADNTADRAVEILGQTLAGGKRLTRAQCLGALRDAGLEVSGQLGYHLLWYASQQGVTCFAPGSASLRADHQAQVRPGEGRAGPNIGTEQASSSTASRAPGPGEEPPRARTDAFMLLDEFVPDPIRLDREEALATIALRYFRSHGPTTAADLAGWTGLPITQCRRGIAAAGDALTQVEVGGVPMFADAALIGCYSPGARKRTVRALPGFDEYLLGFKDRSLMLDPEHRQAIIPGNNGVFQPTIVIDGRVVGTWRRTNRKTRVDVVVTPLVTLGARDRKDVEKAFGPYGQFLGLPCTVTWAV